ncbi:MAG: hypothetical protein U0176_05205 [Bacteroidia bacterium]
MREKNSLWFLLLAMLVFVGMGCKNECKKVDCVNGACVEGNCLCNAGWVGVHCDEVDQCYRRSCNNGYCADGSCVCDPYWGGSNCATPVNQLIAGNGWRLIDSSITTHLVADYQVGIIPDQDHVDQFVISNLYSDELTIRAYLARDNHSFSFPRQLVYVYDPSPYYDAESVQCSMSDDYRTGYIRYNVYVSGTNTLHEERIATIMQY